VTKRRRVAGESFAEVVASLPDAQTTEGEEIESPIATGSWVDPDGVMWRRRGVATRETRVRQLLDRPDTRVVHTYAGDVLDVDLADRPALWHRIAPYLRGGRRVQGDHTEFVTGEFHDDGGRRLLMIEEHC